MTKAVEHLEGERKERFRQLLKALAARVRSLRLAAGMSGRRFAAAAGITHPTLVAIEAGTLNTSLLSIFMMAEALGVEVRVLLEDLTPAKRSVDPVIAKLAGELAEINKKLELRRDAIAEVIDELQEYLRESRSQDVEPPPRYIKKR